MLHVLRHYLPLRKALLVFSETLLLTLVVFAGMTSHLWRPTEAVLSRLAIESGMLPEDARLRVLFSSVLVSILVQITIAFNELYDFRISGSRYDRAMRFLGSAGIAVLLVIVSLGLVEVWDLERFLDFPGLPLSQRVVMIALVLSVGFGLLWFWRNLFHMLLRRTSFDERVLILGTGKLSQRLVEELVARPYSGFEIVGMLPQVGLPEERRRGDRRGRGQSHGPETPTGNPWFEEATAARAERPERRGGAPAGGSVVNPPGTNLLVATHQPAPLAEEELEVETEVLRTDEPLHRLARRLEIDQIIVAFEERRGSLPTSELLRCRLEGVTVTEAEAFYERLSGKIPAEAMRPSYLIFNRGFIQHPLAQTAKRAGDVLLASCLLLLAWPVMLVTAILIRLDSPGPVLFRQERTGWLGRPFTLLKFRSMRQDAEKHTGPVWATAHDPRITRIGRFLRASRIDELPQLFNVLAGSMSMVGPRPERPPFVAELAEKIPYFHQRHIVKPGITGWAQINYRYGNTLEDSLQKLQYDLFYIKYQSLLFDLSILFNTVKTVVLRKGT